MSSGSSQPRKILVAMQDAVRREPEVRLNNNVVELILFRNYFFFCFQITFYSDHQAAQTIGANDFSVITGGGGGGHSTTSYGFNGGMRKARGFLQHRWKEYYIDGLFLDANVVGLVYASLSEFLVI